MVAHQVLLQPEKGFGLEGNRRKLAFGCFVVVSLLLFVVVLFVGLFCFLCNGFDLIDPKMFVPGFGRGRLFFFLFFLPVVVSCVYSFQETVVKKDKNMYIRMVRRLVS